MVIHTVDCGDRKPSPPFHQIGAYKNVYEAIGSAPPAETLQVGATVVNWFVKMPAPGDNDTGSEKRLSDIGPEVVWLNTPSIAVVEICSSAKTDWGVLIPPVCVRPIKTPPVFHGR